MDAVTLSNKSVNEMATARFSPLKLDKSKNKEDIKKLGVEIKSLPTTLFLKADGTLVKKIEGYIGPEELIKEMTNLEEKQEVSHENKQTEKTTKAEIKWLKSLEKGKEEAKKQQKNLLVKFGADW